MYFLYFQVYINIHNIILCIYLFLVYYIKLNKEKKKKKWLWLNLYIYILLNLIVEIIRLTLLNNFN